MKIELEIGCSNSIFLNYSIASIIVELNLNVYVIMDV